MRFEIVKEKEKTIVKFTGDIDIEFTEIMEDEIIPALQTCDIVELNLANVAFVDSTGIGLLIKLVQNKKETGTEITITHIRDDVFDVFTFLQIPEILGKEVFVKS